MKLLSIATDERRVMLCPKCNAPVQYAKFLARGCFGGARDRAGELRTAAVRGVYWTPVPHECVPIVPIAVVETPPGERGA